SQFIAAPFALFQMALKRCRLFIRQLAIRNQHDVLLRLFTLHCLYLNQPQKCFLAAFSCFAGSLRVCPLGTALRLSGASSNVDDLFQLETAWAPLPYCKTYVLTSLNSARLARSLRVARKSVFFAVSSVVLNISPMVRNFKPW